MDTDDIFRLRFWFVRNCPGMGREQGSRKHKIACQSCSDAHGALRLRTGCLLIDLLNETYARSPKDPVPCSIECRSILPGQEIRSFFVRSGQFNSEASLASPRLDAWPTGELLL